MIAGIILIVISYYVGLREVEFVQIWHLITYHHYVVTIDRPCHLERDHLIKITFRKGCHHARRLILRSNLYIIIGNIA